MSFVENRAEPRETLALPLRLGENLRGTTRDISASGMYLEIRGDHELGGTVMFEMDIEEANMRFTSEGRIVRVEHRDGCTGIAVKLLSPRLQALA
jgi:c-di-GMP-binding flagellar brake protein YcgR